MLWARYLYAIMIYGAPYKNLGQQKLFNTLSSTWGKDDVVKAATNRIFLEFFDKVLDVNRCSFI